MDYHAEAFESVQLTKIVINNCLFKCSFISLSFVAKTSGPQIQGTDGCVYPATLLSENNAIVWFMGAPRWVENRRATA